MVSSIAQPIPKLAEKCVDNLLGLIQKEEVEMLSMLPVTFVGSVKQRRLCINSKKYVEKRHKVKRILIVEIMILHLAKESHWLCKMKM